MSFSLIHWLNRSFHSFKIIDPSCFIISIMTPSAAFHGIICFKACIIFPLIICWYSKVFLLNWFPPSPYFRIICYHNILPSFLLFLLCCQSPSLFFSFIVSFFSVVDLLNTFISLFFYISFSNSEYSILCLLWTVFIF